VGEIKGKKQDLGFAPPKSGNRLYQFFVLVFRSGNQSDSAGLVAADGDQHPEEADQQLLLQLLVFQPQIHQPEEAGDGAGLGQEAGRKHHRHPDW